MSCAPASVSNADTTHAARTSGGPEENCRGEHVSRERKSIFCFSFILEVLRIHLKLENLRIWVTQVRTPPPQSEEKKVCASPITRLWRVSRLRSLDSICHYETLDIFQTEVWHFPDFATYFARPRSHMQMLAFFQSKSGLQSKSRKYKCYSREWELPSESELCAESKPLSCTMGARLGGFFFKSCIEYLHAALSPEGCDFFEKAVSLVYVHQKTGGSVDEEGVGRVEEGVARVRG